MSKYDLGFDRSQLSFDFDRHIREYRDLKEALTCPPDPETSRFESHEEACIEIAAAVKRAMRKSGLSREHMVGAINEYFGWSKDPGCKKNLSVHMLNHYLSKPVRYPIPEFYIFAIQHITKSLSPIQSLAEAEDARVISGDEVRQMAVGKLDETILEMQKLKRDLRGRR